MIEISLDKSPALTLTAELFAKWKSEEDWIVQFEQSIDIRQVYDQTNNNIDAAPKYPSLEEATGVYDQWKGKITKIALDQKKLSRLISEFSEQIVRLRSISFTPEELGKMRFLHKNAGEELLAYHSQLTAQVADLEGRLERIQAISQRALIEIAWIEKHPHRRLEQTIERIRGGQHAATTFSIAQDKLLRNVSSACGSIVGSFDKSAPTEKKTE